MGSEQTSTPPVDVLSVTAPVVAAAGQPLQLTATLTRGGLPVTDAEVQFVLSSNASSVVNVQAVTNAAGFAIAVVPAESAGAPGSSSVVSALTPDGKAVGVRGTIVVTSDSTEVAWQ